MECPCKLNGFRAFIKQMQSESNPGSIPWQIYALHFIFEAINASSKALAKPSNPSKLFFIMITLRS